MCGEVEKLESNLPQAKYLIRGTRLMKVRRERQSGYDQAVIELVRQRQRAISDHRVARGRRKAQRGCCNWSAGDTVLRCSFFKLALMLQTGHEGLEH